MPLLEYEQKTGLAQFVDMIAAAVTASRYPAWPRNVCNRTDQASLPKEWTRRWGDEEQG